MSTEKNQKIENKSELNVQLKTVSLQKQKYLEIFVNGELTEIYKVCSEDIKLRKLPKNR